MNKSEAKRDIAIGRRLKALRQQSGWRDVLAYFSECWLKSMMELRKHDDDEARATITVIEGFMNWANDTENFGDAQFEKYKDRLFGLNPKEE